MAKDTNTGDRNSGDRNSGHWNSGDRNSGDRNSGDWNSGDRNSGYRNSGDWNSGDRNSGDRNSGYRNSGDRNSGGWNSGDWNSGNRNSGWFNTNEPNARFFNQDTGVKLSDFYKSGACPSWSGFDVCVWIDESMMTDQEKKDYPTYKTTGGYLKTIEYKEAWAIFWRKTSEENKQKFLNLPNFDAAIFKEITGIDVEEKDDATEEAMKLLKEKGYKIVKD